MPSTRRMNDTGVLESKSKKTRDFFNNGKGRGIGDRGIHQPHFPYPQIRDPDYPYKSTPARTSELSKSRLLLLRQTMVHAFTKKTRTSNQSHSLHELAFTSARVSTFGPMNCHFFRGFAKSQFCSPFLTWKAYDRRPPES